MDHLEVFRASHPEAFSSIFAAGVAAERDRVTGHLRCAQLSGARELAEAAIGDGRSVEALSASYLDAGLRRRDIQNREADEAVTTEALAGFRGQADDSDGGAADRVADIVVAGMKEPVRR